MNKIIFDNIFEVNENLKNLKTFQLAFWLLKLYPYYSTISYFTKVSNDYKN